MSYEVETNLKNWVLIRDANSGLSITNDAERVCENVFENFGNKRILYRDSDGCWDELVHDEGKFLQFKCHGYTDSDIPNVIKVMEMAANKPQ